MTSRAKFSLLSLTAVVVIGIFLWMRSLASWRPVKIGQVKGDVIFLSADGRTCLTSRGLRSQWGPLGPRAFLHSTDIYTGKNTLWPVNQRYYFAFFQFLPELTAIAERTANPRELQIREVRSGRLVRILRWSSKKYFLGQIMLAPDGKTVSVVQNSVFFQWNINSGQLTHNVKLDDKSMSTDDMNDYALSLDGKQIIGCKRGYGRVWNTTSGHIIRSWRTTASYNPFFFSPDMRIMVYESGIGSRSNSQGFVASQPPYTFVNTTTGKVLWDTGRESVALANESFYGSEVFMRSETSCEVLDISTGRLKRRLAIPPRAGEILRVTHDYIYTQNAKDEILRWRAR